MYKILLLTVLLTTANAATDGLISDLRTAYNHADSRIELHDTPELKAIRYAAQLEECLDFTYGNIADHSLPSGFFHYQCSPTIYLTFKSDDTAIRAMKCLRNFADLYAGEENLNPIVEFRSLRLDGKYPTVNIIELISTIKAYLKI
jgi:hypothetical protein